MNRNETMNPNPQEQDAKPKIGAHETPTEVTRAEDADEDRKKRMDALAELEATHTDLVAEGNARLAEAINKEIRDLRKELGIKEADSGALMSRIMDVKRNEDATEAEKLRQMIMEEKGEVSPDATRDISGDFGPEAKRESADVARERDMQGIAALMEEQGEASRVGHEPLNPDDFDTKKQAEAARAAELRTMVMEEKGEVSPYATRDLTGEIKESPEAMRERAVKELEADLEKNSGRIADLKRALSSIGEDPKFAETKKTLDAELGDRYREQGMTVLNVDALRKSTLREVSDVEIDAAVDSMTVDKNAEYQAIIQQLAMEEAQEDLAKLPDEIGAAIDAVRTDLGEEAVRVFEDKQAREALRSITKTDIDRWGTKNLSLSIVEQHAMMPEQVKAELQRLDRTIKEKESGPGGVAALHDSLRKEFGYDVEDTKNQIKLGTKVKNWFKSVGNPRFRALKKSYDARLDDLNNDNDKRLRLLDPEASKRADRRSSQANQDQRNRKQSGDIHIQGMKRPK
jgi:hypothetical protein